MSTIALTATETIETTRSETIETTGAVSGTPRLLLRLEGAALLTLGAWAYGHFALAGWGFFAALFLVPDAAFLGYLAGPRLGAAAYNATHSLLGPRCWAPSPSGSARPPSAPSRWCGPRTSASIG